MQIGAGVDKLRSLRVDPSAERSAVAPLSSETVAQIVWYLGEYQIRLASWLPAGLHAAALRHFVEDHLDDCHMGNCLQARRWVNEAAMVADQAPEAPSITSLPA